MRKRFKKRGNVGPFDKFLDFFIFRTIFVALEMRFTYYAAINYFVIVNATITFLIKRKIRFAKAKRTPAGNCTNNFLVDKDKECECSDMILTAVWCKVSDHSVAKSIPLVEMYTINCLYVFNKLLINK